MVDSAGIYFIQHFSDIYFNKSVCISVSGCVCVCGGGGYEVSRTYCQVSFYTIFIFSFCLNIGKRSEHWRSSSHQDHQVRTWRWFCHHTTGDYDDEGLQTRQHCSLLWELFEVNEILWKENPDASGFWEFIWSNLIRWSLNPVYNVSFSFHLILTKKYVL